VPCPATSIYSPSVQPSDTWGHTFGGAFNLVGSSETHTTSQVSNSLWFEIFEDSVFQTRLKHATCLFKSSVPITAGAPITLNDVHNQVGEQAGIVLSFCLYSNQNYKSVLKFQESHGSLHLDQPPLVASQCVLTRSLKEGTFRKHCAQDTLSSPADLQSLLNIGVYPRLALTTKAFRMMNDHAKKYVSWFIFAISPCPPQHSSIFTRNKNK
jgi:hypothetical protein